MLSKSALSKVAGSLSHRLAHSRRAVPGLSGGAPAEAPGAHGRPEGCPGLSLRHVLVPLDGSPLAECAIPWAVAVAEPLGARLSLVRVLEPPAMSAASGHHHDAVEWEIRRTEASGHLARIEAALKERAIHCIAEVLEGRPAEQILNFARTHHVDLIVLSTHGEGGLSGWALSSTTLMVVARTQTSLLVVPAHVAEGQRIGEIRLRRILAPLDCSPRAEYVLPLAAALARAHDAELLLTHVVPEPEMPRRLPPSAEDLAVASELTERNRREGERYLADLRDRLLEQHLRVATQLAISSRRARVLRTMADEAEVDLVLMTAHGRTADACDRYGSVTARLVEESSRPILVLQDLGPAREPTPAEEAARARPGH